MSTKIGRVLLLAVLVPAASCDLSTIVRALTDVYVPGVIAGTHGDTTQITLPDTVMRGVPFSIQFYTSGDGCLRGARSTDVSAGGPDTVILRPIDTMTSGPSCTSVQTRILHSATAVLNVPGQGTVRVIGALGSWDGPEAIVDRTVQVR